MRKTEAQVGGVTEPRSPTSKMTVVTVIAVTIIIPYTQTVSYGLKSAFPQYPPVFSQLCGKGLIFLFLMDQETEAQIV